MYKLFVDLDGVLADFEGGVLTVTGKRIEEMPKHEMWRHLAGYAGFYDKLEWTADGKELWDYVKDKEPTVLTGLPWGRWARPQKLSWCRRELGPDVPVITCMSREKAKHARKATAKADTPVLIDDRRSLRDSWEAMGSVFIHHISAVESIAALKEVGL